MCAKASSGSCIDKVKVDSRQRYFRNVLIPTGNIQRARVLWRSFAGGHRVEALNPSYPGESDISHLFGSKITQGIRG